MPGRYSTKMGYLVFAGSLFLILAGGAAVACAGEGSGRVEVINGSEPEAHADPEAEADPVAEPDPVADPVAGVGPGAAESSPPGATQVGVTLQEWSVIPDVDTIEAGETYFLADNVGPDDPHELVVIRTDLAPDGLPVEDGRVPEDEVDIVGEIEPFSPRSQASMVLDLEPGNYVFICNIVEKEPSGEIESHYRQGMFAAFTVKD